MEQERSGDEMGRIDRSAGETLSPDQSARRLPSTPNFCGALMPPVGARTLDFGTDRDQWRTLTDPERQVWMVRLVGVHRGEAIATEIVRAYQTAMRRRDQVQYAASQLADEENHVGLFERFQREVSDLAEAQIRQTESMCGWTCSAYRTLAAETLPRLCGRLQSHPDDEATLVETVALFNVFTEGVLALSRLRTLDQHLQSRHLLPALQQGIALARRDEVRHFLFGVRFLRDAVRQHTAHAKTISCAVGDRLPILTSILRSPLEKDRALRRLHFVLHAAGVTLIFAGHFGRRDRVAQFTSNRTDAGLKGRAQVPFSWDARRWRRLDVAKPRVSEKLRVVCAMGVVRSKVGIGRPFGRIIFSTASASSRTPR